VGGRVPVRILGVVSTQSSDRFLRACRLQAVDRTPVWFMRQAGRYLPEYRELRGDRDILETCRHPDQVAEITLQPLRRIDLDAAILFAPVGALVPAALRAVAKGGTVVCAGIHMSEIPAFPYEILWGERRVVSVANLTRRDGEEFMRLAAEVDLRPVVRPYPLEAAGEALEELRRGAIEGAAVLLMPPPG